MASEGARIEHRFLALTQGDPVGVGPEILLKALSFWSPESGWTPILVAERLALDALQAVVEAAPWDRLRYVERESLEAGTELPRDTIAVVTPLPRSESGSQQRELRFGQPSELDARSSLAAIDLAVGLVRDGVAHAMVTGPVNKASIAQWVSPSFRGHTDYIAEKLGCRRYGHDYLMAFLANDLRVALLSTHCPLREAIDRVTTTSVLTALRCLQRTVGSKEGRCRIALAGLNPHAGEGGLLGDEDAVLLRPAVELAKAEGMDVVGPESPDTIFSRARKGEFDWVLALYHDQGLIAVKTLGFGTTNWTLGLPILRTSVDHGTAYEIAGRGLADARPLRSVIAQTLKLLDRS